MEAFIALENGRVFSGRQFGAPLAAGGEVVFHTGMTGYQEILTDPSYAGQVVVFTAAHIGNYGIHRGDHESAAIHPAAVIVRDFCRRNFHRRSEFSLDQVLRQTGVPALAEVDTRALTTALREHGTCRGFIGTGDPTLLVERARALEPIGSVDWVSRVTSRDVVLFPGDPGVEAPCQVAVLDCGVKKSILGRLVAEGCRVAAPSGGNNQGIAGRRHPPVRDLPRAPVVGPGSGCGNRQASLRSSRGQSPGTEPDDRPYHPEAAPGPSDSLYLFRRFRSMMLARRTATTLQGMDKHAATG